MAKEQSPLHKGTPEYRMNELYRRFRSTCSEMARQTTDKVDAQFETRVVKLFSQVQREFLDN